MVGLAPTEVCSDYPNLAVIFTADAEPALGYAIDVVRLHGIFVLVAQPPKLTFTFVDFIFKDLTVVGSLRGNEKDLAETVDFVCEAWDQERCEVLQDGGAREDGG